MSEKIFKMNNEEKNGYMKKERKKRRKDLYISSRK